MHHCIGFRSRSEVARPSHQAGHPHASLVRRVFGAAKRPVAFFGQAAVVIGANHQRIVSESAAIESLLGRDVPVTSTKSYTGHMLGGAGGTEAALSILAIQEGFIPASLRAGPVDEKIAIRVATLRIDTPIRRVLSNSFAFGGNNVSVLVGAPR